MKWVFCFFLVIGGMIEFPIRFVLTLLVVIFTNAKVDWVPFLWRLVEKIIDAEVTR